jgi:hypothetical protein
MKIFVSYSHFQRDWVWSRLEPCLRSGGAEVLIDRGSFVAGPQVIGQMDSIQDQAGRQVLVLSKEYLKSPMCLHEMKRAIALDPKFSRQLVIPVRRDDAPLPERIKRAKALYVDLRDDSETAPWEFLLEACDVTLGVAVPRWLDARDKLLKFISTERSVNLVTPAGANWRGLIDDIALRSKVALARIDLQHPSTVSRRGLVASIVSAFGSAEAVPDPPEDLPQLARVLGKQGKLRLAIEHFDLVPFRPEYDANLFAALRYLVMDTRQLVLLIQSRVPFNALLPRDHPLSLINLITVEL